MKYLTVIILAIGIVACQQLDEDILMSPSIEKVKAKNEERLLSMSGVVSVGIGRNPDGTTVIVIGLEGPRPDTVQKLPKELEGYPVRVDVIGSVKAQ
jgi:hypothetical protein